jgi:lipopolysaccharide/colanic/teichoic acid biosynthesis glycosyltransferase
VKIALRAYVALASLAVPFLVASYHATSRGGYEFGSRFSTAWLGAYGLLFIVSAFVVGIPAVVERWRQAVTASVGAALAPLVVASLFFILYDPLIPRFIITATPLILGGVFFAACAVNILVERRKDKDVVVAVLDDAEAEFLAAQDPAERERKFVIAGVRSPTEVAIEGPASLEGLVASTGANLIVLSETAQLNESVVAQAARLHEQGLRVRGLISFCDEWLGKLPLSELERTVLWFDIQDLHDRFYPRIKRLMDIAVALLLLPFLLVVVPFVWLANVLGDRGPLIFAQRRVGHRGEEFTILKFRTMTINTRTGGGGEWTKENDERITRLGRFLRTTHLDELPQIINILRGDLSIVGPRPEQAHYVAELSEKIPFYGLRHTVRPGLTGWAQVKYPYGASIDDAIEKLQYELYYVRHQSLGLDARVCVRTGASVLLGRGR